MKKKSFQKFILYHDESRLFTFLYISLSIVLSIVFGLFWLLVIVLLHLMMDVSVNLAKGLPATKSFVLGLWEMRLDFSLIIFSLAIAVYIDVVLGVLGVGHAVRGVAQAGLRSQRAGVQAANVAGKSIRAGSRLLGWQNIIKSFLLTVDDFFQVAKSFLKGKKRVSVPLATIPEEEPSDINITFVSLLPITLGLILFLSILLSPFVLDRTFPETLRIILSELKPF